MALTNEQKLEAYDRMMVIRRFEEKCAELYAAGDIGGFLFGKGDRKRRFKLFYDGFR